MNSVTKEQLIEFEDDIAYMFNHGKIPHVVHLSFGNEDQLIDIFKNVHEDDWIFSTHRSHYHALLKGMNPDKLKQLIMRGDSLHVFDRSINFFSSAIVGGNLTIATGVAKAIQMKGGTNKVWCFTGDSACHEGSFYESVLYADAWDLPITFVIEDNNLSVSTPQSERIPKSNIKFGNNVIRYNYERKYPHCGTGQFIKEYSNEKYM